MGFRSIVVLAVLLVVVVTVVELSVAIMSPFAKCGWLALVLHLVACAKSDPYAINSNLASWRLYLLLSPFLAWVLRLMTPNKVKGVSIYPHWGSQTHSYSMSFKAEIWQLQSPWVSTGHGGHNKLLFCCPTSVLRGVANVLQLAPWRQPPISLVPCSPCSGAAGGTAGAAATVGTAGGTPGSSAKGCCGHQTYDPGTECMGCTGLAPGWG